MWKCKECGEKICATVTSNRTKICTLGKNGEPERCLKKFKEETTIIKYFCDKCREYWKNGTKLEDIAEWEED